MGGNAGSSGGCSTPPPGRRNVGTPPPHPNLSAAGNQSLKVMSIALCVM